MVKCVVFGGAGFIGSSVIDRLLRDNHSLRVFDREGVRPHRLFKKGESVEWVSGDFQNMHDTYRAVEGADIVIHMISTTLPQTSNEDPIFDVSSNIIGTLNLLNACLKYGVKRTIFISSGGTVYGIPQYIPIDEKHPTDPQVSYGITKLAIEKYLYTYEKLHGLKSIVLRVSNPYGQRQRVDAIQGAVGVFLHRALNDVPIEIWGDGSVTRDYLHVGDVADAFAKAITYEGSERVFNISSGKGVSLNALMDNIEDVSGTKITRIYKPSRPFDIPANILCNKRAQEELKWTPGYSIKEGLQLTADWMKQQLNI